MLVETSYIPVNEDDTARGMYITGVGYQNVNSGDPYPPRSGHPSEYQFDISIGRKLPNAALVYVTNGGGKASYTDFKDFAIEAGSLILLYPREWHTYQPSEKTGWKEYWVAFHGDIFEKYMNDIAAKGNPFVNIGINEQIVRLFTEMIVISKEQKIGFQQALCGILLHLLGSIQMIVRNRDILNKDVESIQQARIIMLEKVDDSINLEEIAQSLNMSYSNFRKFFKQYTGVSPMQYFLKLKAEKAKEMLANTDIPVKEIASTLNFDSADYFSSFFRSKVGMPPNDYRNTHRVSD